MKKRRKIISISIGHFIHDIHTSFLSPLLPLLMERFQLTYTSAGALSVFLRLPSIFNPIIGILSDRVNLKYFVILAPLSTTVTMSLIGLAPNYALLAFILLLAGISTAFFHVSSPVLIKRISKSDTGLNMSIFMIGGESARTIGPIFVMCTISMWSVEEIYRLIPLGIFTSIFLYYQLRTIQIVPKKVNQRFFNDESLKSLIKMKYIYVGVFGSVICKAFTASVLATFLPVYLKAKGHSMFLAGSSLSIIAIASIVGVSLSGPLSDYFGKKKILIVSGISAPIIMLLFIFSSGWLIIPMLLLLGLVAFSTTPVIMAMIQDEGTEIPALANGVYMTFNFLVTSIIVLMVGKLIDIFGITEIFYLCVSLAFCGVPFLFGLPSKKSV